MPECINKKIMGREMTRLKTKTVDRHWSREMIPAVLVFIFSIIFSLYLSDQSGSESLKVVYRVFLRFFRYTLFLCLPLYLLKPIYRFILEKGKGGLIQLGHPREITIHPLKHWLFRPFQGIGIGFPLRHQINSPYSDHHRAAHQPLPADYLRPISARTHAFGYCYYDFYLPPFIDPLDLGRYGDPLS